jgi:hypothetical protein
MNFNSSSTSYFVRQLFGIFGPEISWWITHQNPENLQFHFVFSFFLCSENFFSFNWLVEWGEPPVDLAYLAHFLPLSLVFSRFLGFTKEHHFHADFSLFIGEFCFSVQGTSPSSCLNVSDRQIQKCHPSLLQVVSVNDLSQVFHELPIGNVMCSEFYWELLFARPTIHHCTLRFWMETENWNLPAFWIT